MEITIRIRKWRMYRKYAELKEEETDTEIDTEPEISEPEISISDAEAEISYTEAGTEDTEAEITEKTQQPSPKIDVTLNEASRSDVRQFWMKAVSRKFRRRRFAVTEEELRKDFFHLQIALTVETLRDHGMI